MLSMAARSSSVVVGVAVGASTGANGSLGMAIGGAVTLGAGTVAVVSMADKAAPLAQALSKKISSPTRLMDVGRIMLAIYLFFLFGLLRAARNAADF